MLSDEVDIRLTRAYTRHCNDYIKNGYVSFIVQFKCPSLSRTTLDGYYRRFIQLAQRFRVERPDNWRSQAALYLNDAAYIRRHLTGGAS